MPLRVGKSIISPLEVSIIRAEIGRFCYIGSPWLYEYIPFIPYESSVLYRVAVGSGRQN